MGWFMIPVVQLVLPRVPVFSRVHIHSVMLFPVWRAASVLLAQSSMVKQINQTNPEPLRVQDFFSNVSVGAFISFMDSWILLNTQGPI